MKWKPKEEKLHKTPGEIEFLWAFEGLIKPYEWIYPQIRCRNCGQLIKGLEETRLSMGVIWTPAYGKTPIDGNDATSLRQNEYINGKISAHYLEFHKGFS